MNHLSLRGAVALLGAASVLAATLIGCDGNTTTYNGYQMASYFPFDGERTWEYISDDPDVPHKLISTLNVAPEVDGSSDIYTVDITKECVAASEDCVDGEAVRSYKLSSDTYRGTLFWGYSTPEEGYVAFDPPLQLTPPFMKVGDVVETETGGTTWTSTFEAVEHCPVEWTDYWDECIRLVVSEPGSAYPSGTYWVVTSYNIVAWELAREEDQWRLLYADHSPLD